MGAFGRVAVALLVLLLAAPARAAPSEGEVVLSGPLSLPSASTIEGPLLAAYLNDSSGVHSLEIVADRIVVHAFSARSYGVDVAGKRYDYMVRDEPAIREFSNARLSLVARDAGWLGIYPSPGSEFTFDGGDNVRVQVEAGRVVGNSKTPEDPPRPESFVYGRYVRDPHVALDASGLAHVVGEGALKVQGLDFRVAGDEGDATYRTHAPTSGDLPAGESTSAWAFIEFEGRLSVSSSLPFDAALARAKLAWDGSVALTGRGALVSEHARYELNGPAFLRGRWAVEILPTMTDDGPAGILSMRGDLESTTAAKVAVDPRVGLGAGVGIALAIAGIMAVAAVVAVLLGRRRVRRVVDARAVEKALDKPGKALYGAALVEASMDNFEASMKALTAALEEDPFLALCAVEDPGFAKLHSRDDFKAAIDAAYRRGELV